MEVVGAVASVAGVLQLAGNALQAINVLATFVRNVKQAPEEFSAVRREITELSGVLQNILVLGPALTDALDLDRNPEAKAPILTLHRAVWNCHHEMSGWSKKVQKDTAEGKARFTSFMRKLKFATLGKDDIVKLRRSIDSEKQSLTLVLAMLTRYVWTMLISFWYFDLNFSQLSRPIRKQGYRTNGKGDDYRGVGPDTVKPSAEQHYHSSVGAGCRTGR